MGIRISQLSMAEREALQEAVRAQGEKIRQLKIENAAQEEVERCGRSHECSERDFTGGLR